MAERNPQIPEGSWPITEADKTEIRELGRDLHKWLLGHLSTESTKHIKIIAGAFQYVMTLQVEKSKALGDDFVVAQKAIEQFNLSGKIEEPFEPAPAPAPAEEKPTDPEVDAATPRPSAPAGGPSNSPAAPSEPAA